MMTITILYAYQNLTLMLGYRSTQFSTSTDINYHDSSYVFNEDKGFQLAFGIVDIEDNLNGFEEYLEIKLYQNNHDIVGSRV